MLQNKLNLAQIAKLLKAKTANPMVCKDKNETYVSDGFFVCRMGNDEFKNFVNGYDVTGLRETDAVKKLFDNLTAEYKDVKEDHSFLHFIYKGDVATLRLANVNGEFMCIDKKFLDVVSPEKRNAEIRFCYSEKLHPIKLSDDMFVCVCNPALDMFDELKFVLGERVVNDTNTNTTANNSDAEPIVDDAKPFEVKNGTRDGFYEFYFAERPAPEVLALLKSYNMHWNRAKACWFGYVNKEEVTKAVTQAVS